MKYYSISEAAAKSKLTASTIRYYDEKGLLPFIKRDESGRRIFTDDDIDMIIFIKSLKDCNLSLIKIKEFVSLCEKSEDSLKERLELLIECENDLKQKICEIENSLELLKVNIKYFEVAYKNGRVNVQDLDPDFANFPHIF